MLKLKVRSKTKSVSKAELNERETRARRSECSALPVSARMRKKVRDVSHYYVGIDVGPENIEKMFRRTNTTKVLSFCHAAGVSSCKLFVTLKHTALSLNTQGSARKINHAYY